MLNIYIVRHGESKDNAKSILSSYLDKGLTALGRKQSKELAQTLKQMGVNFTAVYVSPLKRAKETAQVIVRELKLKAAKVMPSLVERNLGLMHGKPTVDIIPLYYPDIVVTEGVTYILKGYGVETFPQLLQRAKTVLANIKKKHRSGNILLVAHGDIGKMIFAAYYHLDWLTAIKLFYFKNSDALLLSKGLNPKQAYISK